MSDFPELITEAEACKRLRCSASMLYKERQKGKLTCYKIGSRVLYTQDDLETYLARIKVPAWAK